LRWQKKNRDKCNLISKRTSDKLRKDVIAGLGGVCTCCGEKNFKFLTLDHLYGGGKGHRKLRGGNNSRIYRDVRDEGFPKDKYRVLCYNCNCAIGVYGICPHQEDKV
jgi:hypothetical protein